MVHNIIRIITIVIIIPILVIGLSFILVKSPLQDLSDKYTAATPAILLAKYYALEILSWGTSFLWIPFIGFLIYRWYGKRNAIKTASFIYALILLSILVFIYPKGLNSAWEMPVYPHTSVLYQYHTGSIGYPAYTSMGMKVDDAKENVVNFYMRELPKKNWSLGLSFYSEESPKAQYSPQEISQALDEAQYGLRVSKISSNSEIAKSGQMTIFNSQDGTNRVSIGFTFY